VGEEEMHGRRKADVVVETQEMAKLRLQKIEKYCKLVKKIQTRRNQGLKDLETLELTSKLLTVNPEVYTIWNYRKEIVLDLFDKATDLEQKTALCRTELMITETALKKNVKSYVSWYHRKWIVDKGLVDLQDELALTTKFLALDSRNFHCWDYRRFIVQLANVDWRDEFKYTTRLINENFSNYSAWHYRSALIAKIEDSSIASIDSELDFVLSAFYTEPDDQSAWLYHRWLLAKICPELPLSSPKLDSPSSLTSRDISESSRAKLSQELERCRMLLMTEPNCKWAILAVAVIAPVLAKQGVDTGISHEELTQMFSRLKTLDPLRKSYYEEVLRNISYCP
jgi:geranylgeranyl transferase type-2 subunit alpha